VEALGWIGNIYSKFKMVSAGRCLRRLRTTTQSLIFLETDRLVTIPTARGHTWQGHASYSGQT